MKRQVGKRNTTLDTTLNELNSIDWQINRPAKFQSNAAFRLLKQAALNKSLKQGWKKDRMKMIENQNMLLKKYG